MVDDTLPESNRQEPKGIDGWLLLFCVGAVLLGPARNVNEIGRLWDKLGPHPFPVQRQITIIITVFTMAMTVYGIVVGILLWKKYRRGRAVARQYLLIRMIAAFLLCVLGISWAYHGFSAVAGKRMAMATAPFTALEMAACFVWFLYFTYSKRVRNTLAETELPEKP